jgi:hypothetical protein
MSVSSHGFSPHASSNPLSYSHASSPNAANPHLTSARDTTTPSARTSSRLHGRPTVSDELAGIVEKNQAAHALLQETRKAVNYVNTENGMMEEILRERHRMLTNADLALIVGSVMVNKEGGVNSSILAARRPPVIRSRQRALGALAVRDAAADGAGEDADRRPALPTRSATPSNRISTGRVNFAVLAEQQREMLQKTDDARYMYDRMIADFFTKQQSLSDRFADIL